MRLYLEPVIIQPLSKEQETLNESTNQKEKDQATKNINKIKSEITAAEKEKTALYDQLEIERRESISAINKKWDDKDRAELLKYTNSQLDALIAANKNNYEELARLQIEKNNRKRDIELNSDDEYISVLEDRLGTIKDTTSKEYNDIIDLIKAHYNAKNEIIQIS